MLRRFAEMRGVEELGNCISEYLDSWIAGYFDSFEAMCGDGRLGVSPLLLRPGLRGLVLWPVLMGPATVVGGKCTVGNCSAYCHAQ